MYQILPILHSYREKFSNWQFEWEKLSFSVTKSLYHRISSTKTLRETFKVLNIFFEDMFFLVKEIMTSKIENVSSFLSEQLTTDSGLSFPWASTPFFQSDKQNTQLPSQLFYSSPAGSLLMISVISVTLLSLPLNKQVTLPPWKTEWYFYTTVIKTDKCTISL